MGDTTKMIVLFVLGLKCRTSYDGRRQDRWILVLVERSNDYRHLPPRDGAITAQAISELLRTANALYSPTAGRQQSTPSPAEEQLLKG